MVTFLPREICWQNKPFCFIVVTINMAVLFIVTFVKMSVTTKQNNDNIPVCKANTILYDFCSNFWFSGIWLFLFFGCKLFLTNHIQYVRKKHRINS